MTPEQLLPTSEAEIEAPGAIGIGSPVDQAMDDRGDGTIVATLAEEPSEPKKRGRLRRSLGWFARIIHGSFCVASLIALLSAFAAVPVLQLVTLGYLLHVAGSIATGKRVAESLPGLSQAGTAGLAGLALLILSLPTKLLVDWAIVAPLVDPTTSVAAIVQIAASFGAVATLAYLMWAWIRGGRLVHYFWPQPIRFLREAWRPSTWTGAADRLWNLTSAFELPRVFWLGARAAIGTFVWLIPAMLIIAANRNGQTGLAGLVGFLSLLALGVAMLYLPMLQVHFAIENRLSALFDVRRARADFRAAPWAWFGAMLVGLILAPLPLYLLKIEATPKEVVWLPCVVFVTFMLPARVLAGLAIRRARRVRKRLGGDFPRGRWAWISRMVVRLLMLAVVGVYLLFVYLSQYTSWDGLQTWLMQHAILVPYPFVGV